VIGIIALLIAILLPVLSKARKASATAKCMSNLKQLMMAVQMYANDNQGCLPYTGCGDSPGTPRGGQYGANWLYNAELAPQAGVAGIGTGCAVKGQFTSTDVQSGALYQYLNAPQVYRCPLDTVPEVVEPGTTTPLFNALSSYIMNTCLCNYNWDSANPNASSNSAYAYHPMHKMNEFHPYNVAFWDYPAAGNIFYSAGVPQPYLLHKSDPSGDGTDRPSVSGRHAGNISVDDNDALFTSKISGGVPTAFLDGHVELWPIYAFESALQTPGMPEGASPIWCSPTMDRGGLGTSPTYTMTDIFSVN
jgi:prepilin-type processing-associated H-X9-DG protein